MANGRANTSKTINPAITGEICVELSFVSFLLAEAALDQLDFNVAEKAFVKYENYQGIQFVKRFVFLIFCVLKISTYESHLQHNFQNLSYYIISQTG